MRDGKTNCSQMTGLPGAVLRITCQYKQFNPAVPYDDSNDEQKTGTGFLAVIGGRTLLLTNHHVISHGVFVTGLSSCLPESEPISLRIIGYNPHVDVAILEVPSQMEFLPGFSTQSSAGIKINQEVQVVGFAGGSLRMHRTKGVVSGKHPWPHNRIQTDCTINDGNSGGPVLDGQTGHVVGIVTSSTDGMQNTNFFVGMDAVKNVCERVLRSHDTFQRNGQTKAGGAIQDMGYTLNAIVQPVDAAACRGKRGGGLVVAVPPDSSLMEGDVILEVEGIDPKKKHWLPMDSFLRVREMNIWKYDAIDFRSLLDHLRTGDWQMKVRRQNEDLTVSVNVSGADHMRSRRLMPDCKAVPYVACGGLILQTLSQTHIDVGLCENLLSTPQMKMDSFVIVTHVVAGSPYTRHSPNPVVGNVVAHLSAGTLDSSSDCAVSSLEDVAHFIAEYGAPRIIRFRNGAVRGTSCDKLYNFRDSPHTPKDGMHQAKFGALAAQ